MEEFNKTDGVQEEDSWLTKALFAVWIIKEGFSGLIQPRWGRAGLRWRNKGLCHPGNQHPEYRRGMREDSAGERMEGRGPALAGLECGKPTSTFKQ